MLFYKFCYLFIRHLAFLFQDVTDTCLMQFRLSFWYTYKFFAIPIEYILFDASSLDHIFERIVLDTLNTPYWPTHQVTSQLVRQKALD